VKFLSRTVFFFSKNVKQFSAVKLAAGDVLEKVFVTNGRHTLDITHRHNIACQSPFCFAICFSTEEFLLFDAVTLQVTINNGSRICASLKLSRIQTHNIQRTALAWFTIDEARCHQSNFLKRFFLLKYRFRGNNATANVATTLAALYTYPRKVILVSFKEDGYYNIFPMDFQCYVKEAGIYLLGLRTTNITLQKIIEQKKFVVSDTGTAALETILALGNHHSRAPTSPGDLPFALTESRLFQFPVAAFAGGYKEMELLTHFPLGSHTLLVGKMVHEKLADATIKDYYYIHYLQMATGSYTEV